MPTPAERVRAEMNRFMQALPALLSELRGKWVVFRDGQVQSIHSTEDDAYVAGLASFGPTGGQVVAEVTEVHAVPLTAAVMFSGC